MVTFLIFTGFQWQLYYRLFRKLEFFLEMNMPFWSQFLKHQQNKYVSALPVKIFLFRPKTVKYSLHKITYNNKWLVDGTMVLLIGTNSISILFERNVLYIPVCLYYRGQCMKGCLENYVFVVTNELFFKVTNSYYEQ